MSITLEALLDIGAAEIVRFVVLDRDDLADAVGGGREGDLRDHGREGRVIIKIILRPRARLTDDQSLFSNLKYIHAPDPAPAGLSCRLPLAGPRPHPHHLHDF